MTIIAWDGKTLAADKMAHSAGRGLTVTKIYRIGDALVGLAGGGNIARSMLAWARKGFDGSTFPEDAKREDNDAEMLVIRRHHRRSWNAFVYGKNHHPLEIEDRFTAMGHGRDYALAAMHLGCPARRAVEVACKFDLYCGNGIDAMELF